MRNKYKLIIFIISLAFNAGFIIMFLYHAYFAPKRFMPPPPPKNAKIHRLMESEEMKNIKRENFKYRLEFFNELSKPNYSQTSLDSLIDNLSRSQQVIEDIVIQNFIELRNTMTDEEANDFFGKFQDRYNQRKEKHQHHNRHDQSIKQKNKRSPK